MRTSEIIREIQNLPADKRIYVIEKSIHSLRENKDKSQLKKAAELLYSDYMEDKELTALSDIDLDTFYEAKWNLADQPRKACL